MRELMTTEISLTVETPRGRRELLGMILAHVDRPAERYAGELMWEFSKTFRAVVKRSHHWAAISARAVLAMECKYSPWLYQLCALHAGRERVAHEWDLEDLRERLGASSPSLHRWQDFKRRVLEPAVAEVNHLTGIGVAWEPIKHGRSVVGLRLFTWRKAEDELKAASAELDRPRGGRKVRRRRSGGADRRRAGAPPAPDRQGLCGIASSQAGRLMVSPPGRRAGAAPTGCGQNPRRARAKSMSCESKKGQIAGFKFPPSRAEPLVHQGSPQLPHSRIGQQRDRLFPRERHTRNERVKHKRRSLVFDALGQALVP